ncbi:MAG: PfkB family carbohydrate kinase [Spirochaetales bacterium]|uniref:PfkB family carbohydrate kinase n=1 Tax=Candidatus Thalassospirochaeta sargassi TaxID=3119039 RepID=A0AAJ1IF86_9SPIO|nr:PfkB family carbohydrate kinase [Spirochaetales bacterium]
MSKNPDVICCGHAAYDLNFMMDEFPIEDRKYRIDELVQTGGGPASNAATLVAQWGAAAAFAGMIGDDIYGRLIIEELKASKVDTSLVCMDGKKSTPLSAVIVNTKNGSRTLLNRRNENDQPAVTKNLLRKLEKMQPKVLHFDGHALELSLKMMEMFPEAKVVVDAGSYREATDRLCSAADYAVCSKRFAEVCTGIDDIENEDGRQRCIELLGERFPGHVIVTLGAGGLFYDRRSSDKTLAVSMPAYNVEAVDSTGAGDIFHGAFSFGLLNGYSFNENLKLASAAAALSVVTPGARTSIPTLDDSLKLAEIRRKTDD